MMRWRESDFFNTLEINSAQTGTDPIEVTGMMIQQIELP